MNEQVIGMSQQSRDEIRKSEVTMIMSNIKILAQDEGIEGEHFVVTHEMDRYRLISPGSSECLLEKVRADTTVPIGTYSGARGAKTDVEPEE